MATHADSPLAGKRILFVFPCLDLGGAERRGLYLAQYLKEKAGAEVHVWGLLNSPGRVSEVCDSLGIPWKGITFWWPLEKPSSFLRMLRLELGRLKHLLHFALALRRAKPDIVISYTFTPNVACSLTWRASGARLFVWNQCDDGLHMDFGFWNRLAVRMSPLAIANARHLKELLVGKLRAEPDAVIVINNGVSIAAPVSSRQTWRERLELADDDLVACMVANIRRIKDHETLLRAWKEVVAAARDLHAPPKLVLAGRVDEGGEALVKLAGDLDISGCVRFAGRVDDVSGVLSAADLFVYCSKSEGLPNAVVEAMAVGLPVVATDIPGVREAVGDDYRHLAPAGDVGALAGHILEFFREKQLRSDVGRLLGDRAKERFSLARMCEETCSVIESSLKRKCNG